MPSSDHDVSRRTFLKFGAAGTTLAALTPTAVANPGFFGTDPIVKKRLTCPPSLADMASDPQRYQFRDLFNSPAAMNEFGYAQVGKSVSAITAISFPPYACCAPPSMPWSPGYLLTCELFLDGRFAAIAPEPEGVVEYQWFPHCVFRNQTMGGLQISTRMFLPSKQRAVMQTITVKNASSGRRTFTLGFDMRGAVAKQTTPWFVNSPGEADNKITYDARRGCLIFEAQHSQIVGVQGFHTSPDRVEQKRMLLFDLELGSRESKSLNFTVALAGDASSAVELYDKLQANFAGIEKESEATFDHLVGSAFTPGNSEFSGNLPRLVTDNEALWKLYHNGFANLLFARRVSPDSVYGPTYLTLSGHVLPTLSFPWDTSLTSLALALLDPTPLRTLVEAWLKLGLHDHHSSDYISGQGAGPWYAVNDTAIVRCAWRYICVTGDFAWLDKKIGAHSVLEGLEEHALYWKKLDPAGHGLGDYGTIENLLEVVSTYLHEVAGMNANNVHSMRVVAAMHEHRGNQVRAQQLRAEAKSLAERIIHDLYVAGKGYWRCRQPDGSFNEVRHCYDFLAVLDNMAEDLSPAQKQEMAAFFWRELRSETWMRALSQSDADATWNIRPDHSCLGAYGAWPAMSAKGLYKAGSSPKLSAWLKQVAKAGNQGPIGQGHFIEDVFPPVNGGARKASEDAPYIEDWCCIAAGSFTELVIDSIFGAELTMKDGIRVNSRLEDFDPNARLEGLRYQGSLYSITKNGAQKQTG
ncbi:hypothetical protein Acid345_0655 [Candidatus Koribacter versatilis Ellin345]|uniref:Alpha-L-rhamnosidase six-hairpin glycosidase domain-containing protein n=1 Tax=Koribacter versatilis (strain Ellin345) TaxID=204669 RepID=Q1ITZ0_KORVE|nr:twin-arginine translocation signal domain-containing protein [Candidatus Koribacter versatilis]ABF39660.1 hypothetical protein Acid345_0655 [Candidatus Koribacter versatilis Ellin345]